jgi:hypothetical protein
MQNFDPRCPDCDVLMEEGFILDSIRGEGVKKAAEWVEGPPVRAFWGGVKTENRQRYEVQSFRCPKCGLLREYAP